MAERKWHIYDVSGKEVIDSQQKILRGWGYLTKVTQCNQWYTVYTSPEVKKLGNRKG